RSLDPFMAFMRRLARRRPLLAVRASLNTGALFQSEARVRELLVGQEASAALVAALRKNLGGETMRTALEARKMGNAPLALPGDKLLYIAARQSAFYHGEVEASAREYGAACVVVDGPHNLMMTAQGARPAAQAIEAFLARLSASQPQSTGGSQQ